MGSSCGNYAVSRSRPIGEDWGGQWRDWGDKGMEGRSVDFLYTICRYIATIHTDIVEKLTRSVEIVSQKNGHYFLNQHYLYKDRLYLLVRQDLLK